MASSINGRLSQLANDYYISHGTPEALKISNSVNRIKQKLTTYFGVKLLSIGEFGSYKRDTLLPRKFDEDSDVDLMLIFDQSSINVTPGTYRNYLVEFANRHYSRSEVYKSAPTVVLELDHIKYDLVPAYEKAANIFSPKAIFIPQSDTLWMLTDPNGFSSELTRLNIEHNSQLKKVIRLLKAWNAKVGYPISSFQLEQEISKSWFISCRNLEDYFFAAINSLSANRTGNVSASDRVQTLKENARKVRASLQADNVLGASNWLAHILPT
jgi:predicted nucleotidyltransferase